MTYAVSCNVCGNICQDNQYVSLQAWQGKDQHQRRRRGRSECWTIKQREDAEQLFADVCTTCLRDRLPIVRLNSSKTRKALIQELRESKPELSNFELLRKTVDVGTVSATCDICRADCIDKHLKIRANWSNDLSELSSELCERCVNGHLVQFVHFQVKQPKT